MKRISCPTIVLFLAVIVALAGCAPAASGRAVGLASGRMLVEKSAGKDVAAAAGSPQTPPASAAQQATADGATTISSIETSMRLTFAAGALAQPVPVGSGQYRVGTIEVSSPGVPVQTLEVVMDQPNTEWVQLPLRTDDMNFDGKPDLVVTQPVGAKWGRLHVWLYDSAANGFITNTLTAELRQLSVGSYRVDPVKKTLHITNALGMTPFEAVYETAGGHLMPVLPTAAPDAGARPDTGQGMQQLVFASARSGHLELYATTAGGSKTPAAGAQAARQLTHSAEWKGSLVAAPDGARIAYVSETRNADGSPADREIYLLTLDGSQPINLTTHPALDFEPAWSPDGKQLAFVSNRGGDRYSNSIYILDVAAAVAGGGSTAARLVATNAGSPTWSPDGRQIAFISDQDTPGQAQVYVVGAPGGEPRRLTDGRKTGNGSGLGRPAWSPDGTQLAVPADWEGNREIFLVPVAPGGKPLNLTRDPAFDDSPVWSPDGNRLAFISDRGGRPSLYVADADGTNVIALAPGLTAALGRWSPDSRRLAFVGIGEDLNQEIYVVDAGGTGLAAVTDDPAQDTFPVWAESILAPA